jgi:C4-dicarboxylate transporter DctQ subunit
MKRAFRVFDRILEAMIFLSGLILIFVMLSVCLEVILRYFFNRPQIWVTEITECLLLYITFMGSAWLLREEGHVKVDILLNMLKPRTLIILGIISSVIGVFVSVVLTGYGFRLTWDYLQRGIYTPTAMEIPVSAIIVIIPVGSLLLLVQFLRRTGTFIAGFFIESAKQKSA